MHRARWIRNGLLAALVAWTGCDGADPASPTDPAAPTDRVSASRVPSHCPSGLHKRSAQEVLQARRAALAAGDLDAAMCNYALDATVIGDGGIDTGHGEIRSGLQFFLDVFEGTQPIVVQEIALPTPDPKTHLVRVLWTLDTACLIIPDGVDTYLVSKGLIHGQTSHGFPVFTCF